MKVALVHDYLNQYGGAERVLEAFCQIFPEAPIYTLFYDKKKTGHAFDRRRVETSFLQKIPLVRSHHRPFLMLMPIAIEQFDLSEYDLVLSDSASYAKGVVVGPQALHICYCHTPIRYAWDDSHRYIEEFGYPGLVKKIIPFFMNYIRFWDSKAAQRVDEFIANSRFVANRIKKYYRRDAKVIYPPVNSSHFYLSGRPGKYFLMVGRFLPYKRFDLAIEAFNRLGQPLKIVGDGPDRKRLKKIAKSNIEFVGLVSEEKLRDYYANCLAFIFPQEEDFGITAVEAMAAGRPVIAYRAGGALEIVQEGLTGIFFNEQEPESLMAVLKSFRSDDFSPELIRQKALEFDQEKFKEKIRKFIDENWHRHQSFGPWR
ncbi:MAG: glycosyl transferase [Parcubacteria group bacterium CG1_02_44_65]|uniref:Glycosyltransferase family 4 protein n=3 Tax=Candidatus Portnoyibacteriota TaxID=1817913 RepID=A0A2M7YLZ7_9BACT|nr:MAG: glycosyl transferase [Parcubacteria group bacterium CG1_02_44_65]PIP15766.1 MAG: glycosyl transferase [Candidatus Portnoybacteria bacterium CG23_combo_of_CG06-09_8_20_14_all_44_36]PIZ69504.1 MAG: glycosyltransferase family 4 protein [Candidatus Portnoybacteria bacterium CG_4_10_14_0_2_um_filter_43_36]PJA64011.1 MAG: glycosyltransferase family 4 protein [Candidatus Portnoybacteria bacterium CG_4_9_14_3_um_filter_43_11]PJE59481.1 MAG: glycosyltransferase family 4 protein [Candidatus Portn